MTLQQAHKITSAMSGEDNRCPTDLQREAKETIFREVIRPNAEKIEDWMEPDFLEGWR